MKTRFDDWPVVTLVAEGEPPGAVRDAVLGLLHSALERGQPFAAVLDLTATEAAKEADHAPRTAEHAKAVKEIRPALANRCRGLAFVGGERAPAPEAGLRFWGCPVVQSTDFEEAASWARESLAAADRENM
ncbi:hypothetical protein [Streptomyces sp. LaPpAH-108]|uniref:hypothetical protein n=1 Tax=Streptomyces sp. LaPpAH-108 TaxID=1155714 RepID=UPI0003640AEA|nr:hypothetical protein [Streptomyces sp. LaPpAH-108]